MQKNTGTGFKVSGSGFVLAELLVAVIIVGLLVGIVSFNFIEDITRSEFEKRAYELIRTMQLAHDSARSSDRRYAVIFDRDQQIYILREFAALELDTIPEEEAIIKIGYFDDKFQFDNVVFDDDTFLEDNDFEARFYAGRSGWQNGGKILVRDSEGNLYSILIHRLTSHIELKKGDAGLLIPLYKEELPF